MPTLSPEFDPPQGPWGGVKQKRAIARQLV